MGKNGLIENKEILKEVGKYVYALRRKSDGMYFGKSGYHQKKPYRFYGNLGHLKSSIVSNGKILETEHEVIVFELVEKQVLNVDEL